MSIQWFEIGNYIARNYLLKTDIGWIAIDTGFAGGCDHFLERFRRLAPIEELRYIFLTHAHDDHAGFLADLLERCDAKVILHPAGLPMLESGQSISPEDAGYSSWVGSLYGRLHKSFAYPPVQLGGRGIFVNSDADQVFANLGLPIRIIALPGHTADSIGLMLNNTGEFFCGDAAMNAVISIARHTIWIDNADDFKASWDKILACKPKRIYPSHGNPFSPTDLVKYRYYLDGRQLIQL